MKEFKGKAIYNPSGRAGEYSYWACNFYTGCSNSCTYCYCKRGVLSSTWSDKPMLKKCFKDEKHALETFEKELMKNIDELREYGLFFSFTTDPMLASCLYTTMSAVNIATHNHIPVKILTKCTRWVDDFSYGRGRRAQLSKEYKAKNVDLIAIGFTLTGHDELEPNAETNVERIQAMKSLHNAGFKTFASIEPIVDLESSKEMILQTLGNCDLYKVGLMSGKKYDWRELRSLMLYCSSVDSKFYFKDSFLEQVRMSRAELPTNCVGREYNIFKPS